MLDFLDTESKIFIVLVITYAVYSLKLYKLNMNLGTIFGSLISIIVGLNLLPVSEDSKLKIRTILLTIGTPLVIKTFCSLKKKINDKTDVLQGDDVDI